MFSLSLEPGSVTVVTRLRVGQKGFDSRQGRIFLFATTSGLPASASQPSVQLERDSVLRLKATRL
jgi:hypothetical protein